MEIRLKPHLIVLTALAALIALPPGISRSENLYADLPSIGDSAGSVISPVEERKLGAAFMRSIRQAGIVLDDLEITGYLKSLGRRLATNSDTPAQPFTFFVVNEPSINAFAGPGGYIGVHTGLFIASETESELAGVLAHEIAHVTQRHLARAFEAADNLSIPSMAALIAAILIGTQNPEAGVATAVAAQAGSMQYQINFTRANEYEADRVGIQTLANAGLDPYGMPMFFERLQKNSRLYGSRPPEFLSTHPVTTNRISEATSRAEKYPAGEKDSLDFQLIRAKLQVLIYDDPNQVIDDYRQYRKRGEKAQPYRQYEYALLLSATNNNREALKILKSLHNKDPDRIAYRLALADIYNKADEPGQAITLYEDSLELYPGSLELVVPYARTLLATGQASKAYIMLRDSYTISDISNEKYNDPHIYKLLAQAAEATDREAQMHGAMSQYYFLNGFTRQAVQQLQLASREPGLSNYESARIQARLKELKALLAEEEKQK
ncbi:MAG: M48 family metalloprotease [Pseudomonadota bacterium]